MARIPFIRKKNYNGITTQTTKKLQLGASAVFKNFVVGTDTYASAKTAGKCLGATRGGVNFRVENTIEQIEVDGAGGRVKGLGQITEIAASAAFSLVEMTAENLALSLSAAVVTDTGEEIPEGYSEITGTYELAEEDFIENITIIGCISGTDTPIIIQLLNGFNEDGLNIQTGDEGSGVLPVTVYAYNDLDEFMEDDVKPPYRIYYPTATNNSGTNTDPEP